MNEKGGRNLFGKAMQIEESEEKTILSPWIFPVL
jgi:hypothetical protein